MSDNSKESQSSSINAMETKVKTVDAASSSDDSVHLEREKKGEAVDEASSSDQSSELERERKGKAVDEAPSSDDSHFERERERKCKAVVTHSSSVQDSGTDSSSFQDYDDFLETEWRKPYDAASEVVGPFSSNICQEETMLTIYIDINKDDPEIFHHQAKKIKESLEEKVAEVSVEINFHMRDSCFVIRDENGRVFLSLYDLMPPYYELRYLNLETVVNALAERLSNEGFVLLRRLPQRTFIIDFSMFTPEKYYETAITFKKCLQEQVKGVKVVSNLLEYPDDCFVIRDEHGSAIVEMYDLLYPVHELKKINVGLDAYIVAESLLEEGFIPAGGLPRQYARTIVIIMPIWAPWIFRYVACLITEELRKKRGNRFRVLSIPAKHVLEGCFFVRGENGQEIYGLRAMEDPYFRMRDPGLVSTIMDRIASAFPDYEEDHL